MTARHARYVQRKGNSGWPTGREPYGHGVSVVAAGVTTCQGGRESRPITRRGVPEILYADNGAPFANAWLARTCAVLGIRLIHSRRRLQASFRRVPGSHLLETGLQAIQLSPYRADPPAHRPGSQSLVSSATAFLAQASSTRSCPAAAAARCWAPSSVLALACKLKPAPRLLQCPDRASLLHPRGLPQVPAVSGHVVCTPSGSVRCACSGSS
jgi:hypothetical protein